MLTRVAVVLAAGLLLPGAVGGQQSSDREPKRSDAWFGLRLPPKVGEAPAV